MPGGDPQAVEQAYQRQQREKAAADKAWAQVSAAHAGGHHGAQGFTTNFENAGNLDSLRTMIMSAVPSRMYTVAESYAQVHEAIHTATKDMGTHVNNMLAHWTGQAADGFRQHADQLNTSLTNGAQYAQNAHNALHNSAQALEKAQADMPRKPSDLGRLWHSFWDEGDNDYQFKQDAAKYGLAAAVQKDGDSLTLEGEDYQKAVVVMETLATKYNANSAALANGPGTISHEGNWPTPVKHHPKDPVTPPNGGSVQPPKHTTGGTGGSTESGTYHGASGVSIPASPGLGSISGTGVSGGVAGAKQTGLPNSSTSLDGISGGIKPSGSGSGWSGTAVGAGGVSGGLGSSGLGSSGLVSGIGSSGVGGIGLGANESASGARESAATGEGEQGMMGGLGGLGRGNGRKNKRKQRASYLLEDEETWMQDQKPNPPVIG